MNVSVGMMRKNGYAHFIIYCSVGTACLIGAEPESRRHPVPETAVRVPADGKPRISVLGEKILKRDGYFLRI